MVAASSSFTGTENPLSEGGVWAATSAFWGTLRKATGVTTVGLNQESSMRYTGATFSADHYSEVVLSAIPTGGQLLFQYANCRMNTTAGLYQITTSFDVGPNILQVFKVDNAGTFTQIGANLTLPRNLQVGDSIRLEVVGTTLTSRWNGAVLRQDTDSTFSTGQPGIGGYSLDAPSNVPFISSWNAADLVRSALPIGNRTPSYRHSI